MAIERYGTLTSVAEGLGMSGAGVSSSSGRLGNISGVAQRAGVSGEGSGGYFRYSDGAYVFEYEPAINYDRMNQLMYGTINPTFTPVMEQPVVALYGVAPMTPTPISGGVDLSVSKAKIEENISILRKASTTLKDTWQSKTKDNLATIQNSWAGPDCESYINNVNAMDKKVNATISALDLLTQTYQKALDLINENQSRVMNVINR